MNFMFILLVNLHVKPEYLEAFREASIENARSSRQEPDVVRFDVLQRPDDPTQFAFYEVYRRPEGHASHRESAHYKAWVAKTSQMFQEERTRTIYSNVFPADSGW